MITSDNEDLLSEDEHGMEEGEGDNLSEDNDEEENENSGSGSDSGSSRYEVDIEDAKEVQTRRKKLPKSAVDDQFFNLAEMETFLNEQEKMEEQQDRKKRNLGKYDAAEEIESLIHHYEEENLRTRSWALQGEVLAEERQKDELLEHKIDVDYRATEAPTITEEITARLESIIAKRVSESLFDDVVRKVRMDESVVPVYRHQVVMDQQQGQRKSLAEVYEEKFMEEMNNEVSIQVKPELDPQVAEIKKDMDDLFVRLDALSHFCFRPRPIREEVNIINNMPSLRMEEVGPMANVESDANLLAPEEVMRRIKAPPKADDERTETDKKRERRHKKKRQHVLASLESVEKRSRKTEEGKDSQRKINRKLLVRNKRKLDFAGQLNALTSSTAAAGEGTGTMMKRKKKGDRAERKIHG